MSILNYLEKSGQEKLLGNNLHYCNICPYFTTSTFFLANHLRTHGPSFTHFDCENSTIENYHCEDCDFQTDLFIFSEEHRKKAHSLDTDNQEDINLEYTTERYICKNCNFETHFSMKWLQHSMDCKENALTSFDILDGDTPLHLYECDESPYVAQLLESVKTPKIKIHIKDTDNKVINLWSVEHSYSKLPSEEVVHWYYCGICPYGTKLSHALTSHINLVHLHERNTSWYRCVKCAFKTRFKKSLQRHLHKKHSSRNQISWYRCNNCPYQSKSKALVSNHVNRCLSDKKNTKWCKCDQCSFKTESAQILQCHIYEKHQIQDLVHSGEDHGDSIKSERCSFKTKYIQRVQNPPCKKRLDGKDITWYQCGYCPFKSKNMDFLQGHINIVHSKEGHSYECEHCEYKTRSPSGLEEHVICMHLKEDEIKWYSCEKCQYRAKLQRHLNEHLQTAHHLGGRSPLYKCGHCFFMTQYYYRLQEHLDDTHPLEANNGNVEDVVLLER